jgi:hypothetical protein
MLSMPILHWRAAGWVFAGGGALTVALLVLSSLMYRVRLDYRFEVAAISITWLLLTVAPVLLIIAFFHTGPGNEQRATRPEMSRS